MALPSIGCKVFKEVLFIIRKNVFTVLKIMKPLIIVQKLILEVVPLDCFQVVGPLLVEVVDERSGIVLGAEIGFPKRLVGRLETKIKVEAVAEDEDYSARFRHEFSVLLGVVQVFVEFLFEVVVNLVVGIGVVVHFAGLAKGFRGDLDVGMEEVAECSECFFFGERVAQ